MDNSFSIVHSLYNDDACSTSPIAQVTVAGTFNVGEPFTTSVSGVPAVPLVLTVNANNASDASLAATALEWGDYEIGQTYHFAAFVDTARGYFYYGGWLDQVTDPLADEIEFIALRP